MAKSNASAFLYKHYEGVSNSTNLGLKVKSIRWGLNKRDVNTAVQAGERMAQNMIATQAIEDGDEATIENMVTVETGVHPVKVQQGVTLEQVQMVVDASSSKNLEVIKRYLAPPKKRGRKAKKP